jgi:hypothetical protein
VTQNQNETSTETALSVRQQKLLAVRDEMAPGERPAAIVPHTFAETIVMCEALARAELAPKHLRGKPTDMALVIMTGAEVGLPPMASLRLYTTWDGVPRLMAEGVRAVILQSPAIEYFEMATCSDTEATWIGKRRGRPEKSVTWTIERAKRAGLLDKPVWKAYQQDMLNARASMQLGRILAPDVVAGMVALEEARDGDFIEAQAVEVRPTFAAPPSPPPGVPVGAVLNAQAEQIGQRIGAAAVTTTGASEKPKAGRLPKDKPAERPTTPANAPTPSPQPSGSTSPAGTGSTSEAAPGGSSPTSKLDAAIQKVEEKIASGVRGGPTAPADEPPHGPNADRWGQPIGPTSAGSDSSESRSSSESAQTSTSETVSGAGSTEGDSLDRASFGPDEDPVDSAPAADPVAAKLEEYKAFLAGCKTQREMQSGFPQWRVWTVDMSKAGDARFLKDGELTKLITKLWGERKAELPA